MKPNPAQSKAIKLLELPDEHYFNIGDQDLRSLKNQLAPAEEMIERGAVPPVLAIGAPHIFNIGSHDHIPVLVAKCTTGQRAWEVDVRQNLTWIIVDLQTGRVKVVTSPPFDRRGLALKPSRTPPPPDPVNRTAVTYGIERMNLPPVFGNDWPAGQYAVTLVVYDWISNTAIITSQSSGVYSSSVAAVPVPIAGIKSEMTLSLPGDGVINGPTPLQMVLMKSALPVSLVLLKLDAASPILIDVAVPAADHGVMANSRFSIDLREAAQSQALSGEYQAYLVSGQVVAGPTACRAQT